ncbi:MAG: hypothetical protein ACF8R9_01820 [Phycisphaerales bacterium JB054]
MLSNLRTIVSAGGDLIRSEGTILAERLRRIALWSGLVALATLVLLVAAIAISVAATAALAAEIGWIPALAIAGSCALMLSIATLLYARRAMTRQLRRSEMPLEPRTTSTIARQEIADALPGTEPGTEPDAESASNSQTNGTAGPTDGDLAAKVTKFIADHPAEIAGGAVAVLGLIGPVRSFRLLSRGVVLAGIAQSIVKQMGNTETAEAPGAEQHASQSAAPPRPTHAAAHD